MYEAEEKGCGEGAGRLGIAQTNLVTKWNDANQNRQTDKKAGGQTEQLVGRQADRQAAEQIDRHNNRQTGSYLG